MNKPPGDEGLKRVVGVFGLSLNIVNVTIGAGIFALPAIVGIQLGAFSIFAYIFCGIMMAAIMLCYAEIGTRVTATGGSYAYVSAAYGDFGGFVISWLYIFGWCVLGNAALLNIVADSMAVISPVFLNPWIRGLLSFVLLGFLAITNICGAKKGVAFIEVITLIKLLPLLAIILFGLRLVEAENLQWEHLPALDTFGNTTLVLFFAFAGFESALCVSGEIKNPGRTIPIGILLGGLVVLLIYLLLQTVTQGVLGPEIALARDAPLAAVAERIVGPTGGTILLLVAAISCFGTVSTDVLNSPRVLYAGARDGLFPKFLGKVHPQFATPHWAIGCYAAMIFIFTVFGGFEQLAILASAAVLLIYLLVILATIKLRKKKVGNAEKIFRVPGGLIVPCIGIASIVWLLTSLKMNEIVSSAVFIGIVCVIYIIMKWIRGKGILPKKSK